MNKTMPKSWNENTKPHLFCPGCGHGITLKQLGYAIDDLDIERETTLGIDIGCSLLAWNFFNFDTIQTHHGRTTPLMVGYKMVRPSRIAIAYMGDGGGYAIGLQSLLHAAIRNNPITVILVNNENYAMTGGQMAPTTEEGVKTATSPNGKEKEFGPGLKGPELVAKVSHLGSYICRVSVDKPETIRKAIIEAIKNQQEKENFSFIEVLSTCPTNWKTDATESIARVKAMEKYYKLGKIEHYNNKSKS